MTEATDSIMLFAEAAERIEHECSLEELGAILSKALCAVTARLGTENPKVWPVETTFVEGSVDVTFQRPLHTLQ